MERNWCNSPNRLVAYHQIACNLGKRTTKIKAVAIAISKPMIKAVGITLKTQTVGMILLVQFLIIVINSTPAKAIKWVSRGKATTMI